MAKDTVGETCSPSTNRLTRIRMLVVRETSPIPRCLVSASRCGGYSLIDRVLQITTELVIPSDLTVGPNDKHSWKARNAKGINRRSGTVPVRPSDTVSLDEGFALSLGLSSFGGQSDESDASFAVLVIGLYQTWCRTGTRPSPVSPDVYHDHFTGELGFTRSGAVQPALSKKCRRRSSRSKRATCFSSTTTDEHHDDDER